MEAIKTTIAENVGGSFAHSLAPEQSQFSLESCPDLSNKVAVVTGGSEGIGYGCTHTLLSKNISKLFILSLSKDIVDDAISAISKEMGDEKAKRVVWKQCDLSDWRQTSEVSFDIAKSTDRLDILICNAARGIMTAQKAPSNGVDLHMACNHMGHAVLTSHLLPLLKKTSDDGNTVRIVHLASNAHQMAPKETKFESLDELNKDFGPNPQYGRSKLAAILYARYLADHLRSSHPRVLVNATHPGIVETRQSSEHIFEAYPLGGYAMAEGLKPFKKTQFEGAVSTIFAATTTEKSGEYICPPAIVEPGSEMSQDKKLGENLMKLTRDLVRDKTQTSSSQQGCPFKDY
ncbi:NAD(P)-binding protein [Saccharata proteae CBS 121410]|uniref:NAD(P)-binding protein n=1 Tax=Saccharata proteae CBS 121410 TaxID=1314787 RepID=A0A9P4LVT8_9PEZI|nr:NAD(P)-binding protein [Saccharata proteae CBS 121410]